MEKTKITIASGGNVSTHEADKGIMVYQTGDTTIVRRLNVTDSEALGLLELGGYQVKRDWLKHNEEKAE